MNEELKKLRKSVKMLEAKMEFHHENAKAMKDIVEEMGSDLDAFIDVYNDVQQRNE
ncbi:MAG: hypothetical protein AAF944_22740 [Bacteroidota bacterium]